MKSLVEAYRALSDVYLKGSWIGEAVKRYDALLSDKGAYRLVYSVVEREFLSEYRIEKLTEKPPKSAVKLLLKMGMCLLDDFSMPDHAAVNAVAETAKTLRDAGARALLMSGSGATVFAIADDDAEAKRLADAMPPGVWTCLTRLAP